jgi:micrococcal nuclease
MRKSNIKFVLAILPLVLVACGGEQKPETRASVADTVMAVIDGDTFVLSSGKTVRIAMIDTPEEGQPFCDSATAVLAALILGRAVRLSPIGKNEDRYGRLLAEVFVDTLNVGASLMRAGLAGLYLYSDNVRLKPKYLPLQIQAINKASGIWSLPEPEPEDYYVRIIGSYRFHRPLCMNLKRADSGRMRLIRSRRQALLEGYSPCRNCKP